MRLTRQTTPEPSDRLVVGLGNPGAEYEPTRHNVGFRVADAFVAAHRGSWRKSRHRALVADMQIGDLRVTAAKPLTYMNLSGESVKALVKATSIDPEDLLVVHDELDVPFGELRLKYGGGTAGHQGLNSVGRVLGTRDFVRLRLGIGRPPGRMDAADFVLRPFRRDEADIADITIAKAVDVVDSWLSHGVEATQNTFH
ncbi:MAG: aminoacyl-tRNA hydrolase [Acidimicrobiia bacterium]|nr:aminoacyl-tRNA hydrolase [Acidimicrobiia bacterium]